MHSVDPAIVPKKKLPNGEEIPCIGMGTFGSDRYDANQVAEAVAGGIKAGYRLIDCAAAYGNESEIGKVFRAAFDEGTVSRKEMFIISKVWNDMHERVEEACKKSIADLQCDYLDMYIIHWPYPNYHAPGCDADARNPDSKPFSVAEFVNTYRQLEKLHNQGLIRHIGVSNMTIKKLEAVWPLLVIKPAACELEQHPCFQQQALFDYLVEKDVLPFGYMPIGSPERPDRDVFPGDIADIEQPEMQQIAAAHGVHPAIVALKWAVQRGQVPIPFATFEPFYYSNLLCTTQDPLTDEEMALIATLERGNRLVKGQVFLWEGAKDYTELWDED